MESSFALLTAVSLAILAILVLRLVPLKGCTGTVFFGCMLSIYKRMICVWSHALGEQDRAFFRIHRRILRTLLCLVLGLGTAQTDIGTVLLNLQIQRIDLLI